MSNFCICIESIAEDQTAEAEKANVSMGDMAQKCSLLTP